MDKQHIAFSFPQQISTGFQAAAQSSFYAGVGLESCQVTSGLGSACQLADVVCPERDGSLVSLIRELDPGQLDVNWQLEHIGNILTELGCFQMRTVGLAFT